MKTLKCVDVFLNDCETFEDVVAGLPRFLDSVYNNQRLLFALGYLSTAESEDRNARKAAQCSLTPMPNFRGSLQSI